MIEEESEPVEIIRRCVQGMATKPHAVSVTVDENTITVRVAPEDVSRILGPEGKVARALRTVLTVVCATQGTRYALNVQDRPY